MGQSGRVSLADAFLAHHFAFRPVDATFMGIRDFDAHLPPAAAGTMEREAQGLARLRRLLEDAEPVATPAEAIDRGIMAAEIAAAESALLRWPRFANPAWFTGEAAFALISLLLPQSAPVNQDGFLARLRAVPDFLSDGRARLDEAAAPRAWVVRAGREALAMANFLLGDIRFHEAWRPEWSEAAEKVAAAFVAFTDGIDGLADLAAGCGEAHLATLMADVHGLALTPTQTVAMAWERFDALGVALAEDAARVAMDGLADRHAGDVSHVPARYRHWHRAALEAGAALVSPADDFGLDVRLLPACLKEVAKSLYFLAYRCPPAVGSGAGSVYWVHPPGDDAASYLRAHNESMVKITHAVHHGSIGHHTQNHRARRAASTLARVGGTDCALGVAFLSSGTMVEGWACHATDLMAEVPGFYEPAELLLLQQAERRNWAGVLVDINLHLGVWSHVEAEAFYRDRAGFPAARVAGEVARNWMLPGSRLMYALGVDAIRRMRQTWDGDDRDFHDGLVSHGHAPVALARSVAEGIVK